MLEKLSWWFKPSLVGGIIMLILVILCPPILIPVIFLFICHVVLCSVWYGGKGILSALGLIKKKTEKSMR